MQTTDFLIVGGGVAGIAAALVAKEKGKNYLLVESAPQLGGLLRSRYYDQYCFDYGTHFINFTHDPQVDALLMPPMDGQWISFPYLKAGSFFKKLNQQSPLINAADALVAEDYSLGMVELMDSIGNDLSADNMQTQLIKKFGFTYASKIIIPAIEKLFFTKAHDLRPNAQLRYGLHRLIISTEAASIGLKKLPELDDRIAFHSSAYTNDTPKHLYPKQGGVGQWIDYLVSRLDTESLLLNNKIVQLEKTLEGFTVKLESGTQIQCKKLVWTLAPALYFLALGEQHNLVKPELLHTELFHLVFDMPFKSELFYCTDYDPRHLHFRSTLYSNVQQDQQDFRITVEVLKKDRDITDINTIVQELIDTGLVNPLARCIFHAREFLPNTFPVLDHAYANAQVYYGQQMKHHVNACFIGRAASEQFFMTDVLKDTVYKISDLCMKI